MDLKAVKLSLAYNNGYKAIRTLCFRLNSSIGFSSQRLITIAGTSPLTTLEITEISGLKYKTVHRLLLRMRSVGIIDRNTNKQWQLSSDGQLAYDTFQDAIKPALKEYRESIIAELASKGMLR